MLPYRPLGPMSLRVAAALLSLAAPVAAQVRVELAGPQGPLDSLETYTFEAQVAGAGPGVLWSAAEVLQEQGATVYRGVWAGTPGVRFQPDPAPRGRLVFSAQGLGGGLRIFQVRAAAREAPHAFTCVTVEVRPHSGSLPETKARAAETGNHGVVAWETPFVWRWPAIWESFQPAAFRFFEGGPALVGAHRTEGWEGALAVLAGTGGRPRPLADRSKAFEGLSRLEPPAMGCFRDGSVAVAQANGLALWKVGPDGAAEILAGSGQRGWNGEVDDQGHPRPAKAVNIELGGDTFRSLAVLPDQSVVFFEQQSRRILRLTPAGTLETLAGGAEGPPFRGDGQDLRQERPARSVRLPETVPLVAASDGSLILSIPTDGFYVLAADGVLHALGRPGSFACDLVVTLDNRLVYRGHPGHGLYLLDPGQGPRRLARAARQAPAGPGDPTPPAPGTLHEIGHVLPVPGGGLLATIGKSDRVWYLGLHRLDPELDRLVGQACEAVARAGRREDFAIPHRIREGLAEVARADPARPFARPSGLLGTLCRQGRAGAAPAAEGPGRASLAGLPQVLQQHIQSFLRDDPALVLRAWLALHELDRRIAALGEARDQAFRAYRLLPDSPAAER